MNATPYLRLVWKEYRAIRLFWLALVGLTFFIQCLIFALGRGNLTPGFGLAFGPPVLFALGAAGAAFAVEREEGSFDFLQAIPVNSKQLFISKITVSIIATLVMYAVLYPLTLLFTGGKVPDVNFVQTMLAICLTAALEAIAWGTFFSLICMRPLVAICLAMLAGSTVAHVLAWRQSPSMGALDLSAYARAAPWRTFASLLVLAVDVVLGLRWLNPSAL